MIAARHGAGYYYYFFALAVPYSPLLWAQESVEVEGIVDHDEIWKVHPNQVDQASRCAPFLYPCCSWLVDGRKPLRDGLSGVFGQVSLTGPFDLMVGQPPYEALSKERL